jgi:glucose-6-phosphate isomerase
MNNEQLWQRYQDWLYYNEELGFYLDVSRMGFNDQFLTEMKPKFDKAFADLIALETGAIANPDENRMVGHYWLRNPDIAPDEEIKEDIIKTVQEIKSFSQKIISGAISPSGASKFTDVLSIGIGGSALGPEFVAEALGSQNSPLKIHFIDNTDPAGIDKILAEVEKRLNTTLVLVISKSGGTPETRNGMIEVQKFYEKHNVDFPSRAVAVTGMNMNSRLEATAKEENWLAIFPMYDWVGGRTSELSAVGLLPAALQGVDISTMLEGAKIMDIATRKPDLKTNPAALLALSWYFGSNGKGQKDMVVLPYKDSLLLFSRYLQQLVMESLGKEQDLDGNIVYQGLAVYGNKGSTDQHAYVQQLREGVANFFVTFIEVLKDREGYSPEVESGVTSGDYLSGLLQGTRQALYENGRESVTVTIPEVTPKTVGSLIALYERAVSLYASLINVNAYHQPGVEAGKKAATSVLTLQNQVVNTLKNTDSALTLRELATQVNADEAIETIYKIVRHLAANHRGITLEGDLGKPNSLKVSYR